MLVTYSYKQVIKAIFYLRSREDKGMPLFYRDFKNHLFDSSSKNDSRFANILKELKKNNLVEIYRVDYEGLKTPRKAIRLTKFGRLLATRLLYEALTPNELTLFRAFSVISKEKREELIAYVLQAYKK